MVLSRLVKLVMTLSMLFRYVIVLLLGLSIAVTFQATAQSIPFDTVNVVAWSPDGTRLATANYNNVIQIWNAESGDVLVSLMGHSSYITDLDWSPDNSKIASSSNDQTAIIWDAIVGQPLFILSGHGQGVIGVIWSLDGTQVITGTDGIDVPANLRIWNSSTGNLMTEIPASTTGSIAWSPDGSLLAQGTNTFIVLRDAQTLQLRGSLGLDQNTDFNAGFQVTSVAWSPNSATVAVGYLNGIIRVWDVVSEALLSNYDTNSVSLTEESKAVIALSIDANQSEMISVGINGSIVVWELNTGQPTLIQEPTTRIYAANFSRFGARLALGGEPINRPRIDINDVIDNDAVQIVVPDPTLERLQSIAELCNAPLTVAEAIPDAPQADQLSEFIVQVELLTTDSIPPACAADLIAVAEAIQAGQ